MTQASSDQKTNPPSGLLRWSGVLAGVSLALISVVFMIGGLQLGLGSPFRLGTGAFPFATGFGLAVLAGAIVVQDLRAGGGLSDVPDWTSFVAILAALAVFAATVDRFGLIPAVFLTIFVASGPDRSLSIFGKAGLGASVAVATWLLFIVTLNLPFKAVAGF